MLVLLLGLVLSAHALSSTFLQLTDLHLDVKYLRNSDVKTTSCHALNGTAGKFGSRVYCDSPEDLADRTLRWVAANHPPPDFVLLTGDFARHDDYAPIPRTFQEVLVENTKVADKVASNFPNIQVLPSIGNNDCFPHDVMQAPGPNNTVLPALAQAWHQLLDGTTRQQMIAGGWMSMRITDTHQLVSLNTLYFAFGPDCNETDGSSAEQMDWLGALLQNADASDSRVIISGHIPPDLWLPNCRAQYAQLCVSNSVIIRGQVFGHKHSDQFNFVNVDGTVNNYSQLGVGKTIAVNSAPSVVPTFNPSYRIWHYDPVSFNVTGYDQYYAQLDTLSDNDFSFQKEYSLLDAYNMTGTPSDVSFWINLNEKMTNNFTMSLQYLYYKFVSVKTPASEEIVCKRIMCKPRK